MLTLAERLALGPFTVYRDLVREGGQRRFANRFYVAPSEPRLQLDADGAPAFHFLWYREALGGNGANATAAGRQRGASGGLVTLTVELGPSPAERAALTRQIAEATGLASAEIELLALPVKGGTVEFQFAGESTGGELARTVGGAGPARLTGAQCATFLVELTRDGAALLAALLAAGEPAFKVRWELTFDHYLDGVALRVWCDARRAWERAAAARSPLVPVAFARALCEERLAGIELVETTPLSEPERALLLSFAQRTLTSILSGALFGAAAGAPQPNVEALAARPYPEGLDAAVNLTLSESYPLEGLVVVEGLLRLELGREQWAAHVLQIDLEAQAARWLDVQIICAVDFEAGLVESVLVRIEYDQTGAGGRVQRSDDFAFSGTSRVAHFRCDLAAPLTRSYAARASVYYRGDTEPLVLDYPAREDELLVVDAEDVGVLDVAVLLGNVRPELVRGATIELEYPAVGETGAEPRARATLLLNAAEPSGRWRCVVRDRNVGAYRYRLRWTLQDEQRVEGPWQVAAGRRLIVGEPPGLGDATRVDLVATGPFDDLAELLVDLQTPATEERAQYSFTRAGEAFSWRPRVTDRMALAYDVRITLIYSDGVRSELDWVRETRPVLPIRNPLHFELRITARLLGLGTVYRMALVSIAYQVAPTGTAKEQTFVFREGATEDRCPMRLADPEHHQYRYQLTLIPTNGPRRSGPWQEAEDELLVLTP